MGCAWITFSRRAWYRSLTIANVSVAAAGVPKRVRSITLKGILVASTRARTFRSVSESSETLRRTKEPFMFGPACMSADVESNYRRDSKYGISAYGYEENGRLFRDNLHRREGGRVYRGGFLWGSSKALPLGPGAIQAPYRPLTDPFPLEVCEGGKKVRVEPSRGIVEVQTFFEGDERDATFRKLLELEGELRHGTTPPIERDECDLIDNPETGKAKDLLFLRPGIPCRCPVHIFPEDLHGPVPRPFPQHDELVLGFLFLMFRHTGVESDFHRNASNLSTPRRVLTASGFMDAGASNFTLSKSRWASWRTSRILEARKPGRRSTSSRTFAIPFRYTRMTRFIQASSSIVTCLRFGMPTKH